VIAVAEGKDVMATPAAAKARILVVDDHPIVRLGIRQMIGVDPGLSVCGEVDSADAALRWVAQHTADLAIVDLSLGEGSGLELIRALRQAAPSLPILVLSMHDETLFAERTLRAGARGYIMKQEAIDGLAKAIRQVLAGKTYVSERIAESLFARFGPGTSPPRGHLGRLTDRELEVFEMVGRGHSTAAIAEQLGVSVKTIETYRSNIKAKLNLRDAADLIRYAATWTERL
jgi:DNA-binding NarL/FixJ family response regulator